MLVIYSDVVLSFIDICWYFPLCDADEARNIFRRVVQCSLVRLSTMRSEMTLEQSCKAMQATNDGSDDDDDDDDNDDEHDDDKVRKDMPSTTRRRR